MDLYDEKTPGRRVLPLAKRAVCLVCLCFAAVLLAGCGVHLNVNKKDPPAEELSADDSLVADPVSRSAEGSYTVTFRREKGGFKDMDLSRAYVAYRPTTVMDQIHAITGEDKEPTHTITGGNAEPAHTITGGDAEPIPPLPADAQAAMDEALGADGLKKIAVIAVETVDDNTLRVSFTDKDDPIEGREYFFIIPNESLSGSVIPG